QQLVRRGRLLPQRRAACDRAVLAQRREPRLSGDGRRSESAGGAVDDGAACGEALDRAARGIAEVHGSGQQTARQRRSSRTAMIARVLTGAALAALVVTSVGAQRHQYRRTTDWGQLPAGKTWGEVTSVDIAPDGTVFVLSRCFAKDNNGCIGRETEPAILKFGKNGKLLKSWGAGMFVFPHGAFLDR